MIRLSTLKSKLLQEKMSRSKNGDNEKPKEGIVALASVIIRPLKLMVNSFQSNINLKNNLSSEKSSVLKNNLQKKLHLLGIASLAVSVFHQIISHHKKIELSSTSKQRAMTFSYDRNVAFDSNNTPLSPVSITMDNVDPMMFSGPYEPFTLRPVFKDTFLKNEYEFHSNFDLNPPPIPGLH